MSDSTNAILQRAYEHIEKDELEQAQAILAPLLETDDENPSLWWVYSHALRDRSIGQLALDRVLELDPSYPGAEELKSDVLEVQEQDEDLVGLEMDADGRAQSSSELAIDDWEDLQPVLDTDADSSGSRRGFVLLIVFLLIVASGAALVASGAVDISELLSGILPSPEPAVIVVSAPTDEPTPIEIEASVTATAQEATLAPTELATSETEAEPTAQATALETNEVDAEEPTALASVEVTATVEPSPAADETATPLAAFIGDVADSISEFDIIRESSGMEDTLLGDTLVLQLCAIPGREFNERLTRVMNAVVGLADQIIEDIEAVAAGLRNCDDPEASLRIIGVNVSAITEYANEEMDAKDFQRAWQPLS